MKVREKTAWLELPRRCTLRSVKSQPFWVRSVQATQGCSPGRSAERNRPQKVLAPAMFSDTPAVHTENRQEQHRRSNDATPECLAQGSKCLALLI